MTKYLTRIHYLFYFKLFAAMKAVLCGKSQSICNGTVPAGEVQNSGFLTSILKGGTHTMYPSQHVNSGIEPEADEDPEVDLPPHSFKEKDQKI